MVTIYTQAGKIQFPNSYFTIQDGYYWVFPNPDGEDLTNQQPTTDEAIAIFTASTIYGASID